jgi:hypothetical protein
MSDQPMDELIARLQAKIETTLAHHFPERAYPFFDRPQLVSKLMLIAHSHGLEVSQKLMDHYHMYGVQPVVRPEDCNCLPTDSSCPKCSGKD